MVPEVTRWTDFEWQARTYLDDLASKYIRPGLMEWHYLDEDSEPDDLRLYPDDTEEWYHMGKRLMHPDHY